LPTARAFGCRLLGSDHKLQDGDHFYYYPDVQALCDPTDRREKLLVYRGITSLLLYLIIAQDRCEVTVHFRDAAGSWQTRQARGVDSVSIGCLAEYRLSLDAVYQAVLSA